MRYPRALLSLSCLALTLFALPLGLHAEPPPAADASPRAEPQPAGDEPPARAAFEAGRTAFGAGRFDAALAHFELAYELEQHPFLLFNIARAAEFGGRPARAIEAYAAYLAALPDADNRDFVRARLEQLRSEAAPSTAPAVPTPRETAESAMLPSAPPRHADRDVPSRALYKRPWFWTVVGVALAGGVTTAVLLTRDSAADDVDLRVHTLESP